MNIPKPPPSFKQAEQPPAPKPQLATSFKQLDHYKLPMVGAYTPAWVGVLKQIKYPTTAVILDFESFFSHDFTLKDLSTIEYITDPRFEVLGLAHLSMTAEYPFVDYEQSSMFEIGEEKTLAYLLYLKGLYGPNLEGCTVCCHNSKFDITVLWKRYNLIPKYVIDTVDLARNWNSRQKNGLADLTKQYELPAKGDTQAFSSLTLRTRWMKPNNRKRGPKMPVQMPIATDEQLTQLAGYACNDACRQWEVFTLLMSRVANPQIEFRLMRHTLDLFLKPAMPIDVVHGKRLIDLFTEELEKTITLVAELYANQG